MLCEKKDISKIEEITFNPFPAVDKYICFGVFALYARVPEQLVHLGSLCSTYKLCA